MIRISLEALTQHSELSDAPPNVPSDARTPVSIDAPSSESEEKARF